MAQNAATYDSAKNENFTATQLCSMSLQPEESDPPLLWSLRANRQWRNLVAYWLLGLCNNYGYVVMLSAAHDILSQNFNTNTGDTISENVGLKANTSRDCNPTSTGEILLADILPGLIIKIVAPFFTFNIHARILLVVLLEAVGFILVAFATADRMALLGVVSTSLGSGLGEVTLLSYSTFFDKNVVSTWSSGTGGAGILGASSYAGLTSLGLSPSKALLIMLVIPALMAFSFWGLLQYPNDHRLLKRRRMNPTVCPVSPNVTTSICRPAILEEMQTNKSQMGLKTKLKSIPMLFKFMLPLGGVYLFEYFINQGLFEMIDFHNNNIGLSHSEQYRWLQVLYQVGVFVSRSSVNIIKIHQIWLMCLLQFLNVVFFTFQVVYEFVPHLWIIFVIVFWEGLLGGAAYVNTFYRISTEVSEDKREFSMGITSLSDAVGIGLSGFISIPVHNVLCQLPRRT